MHRSACWAGVCLVISQIADSLAIVKFRKQIECSKIERNGIKKVAM